MVCIQYYNPKPKIVRVPWPEADAAVAAGRARYVPRRIWKERVRDAEEKK